VVAGWALYYTYEAFIDGFSGKTPEMFTADFVTFSSDSFKPVFWMVIVIAMTCGIVALGVRRGIERGAKIMMPLLFLFILVLVGCSISLPGASKGLTFLFKPDFSKVTSSVILSAMGQAFFSLSVGLGCLCTYACYFRKDIDLMKDGFSVASIDTLVALLSGLIIFPAVYSISGLQPDAGPSLVFITLPNVFQQVFGNIPWLAYLFSLIFYLLLVMAALTSSVSMLEMSAAYFHANLRIPRPLAAVLVSVVCVLLGTFCSWSFGDWKDVTFFGMGFFDFFDFLVAKLIMPIGGFLMCVFLGWVVDEKVLHAEITNHGTINSPFYPVYRFIIRYFAPICIFLIFANELGLFDLLPKG
jgi:NSS family neurotransmitter:Na+ symporter